MGEKENFVATVSRITPEHRGLEAPEPMRELKGWLTWRYEQHPGEPKPRKIPYYADGGKRYGQQGSPNDRAKLTTFAAARDAAARRGHDGVGFALLADWGITALDFDKCVSPSGDIPRDIMEIVSQSYCEYSPSGEGIRAFIKGDLGNHKSAVTPDQYGFETFSSTGFCTFTNNMLPICEMLGFENHISLADDKVRALCERRFGTSSAKTHDPDDFMAGLEPRVGLSNEQVEELLNVLDPDMPREDWIRVGMAVHHETHGDGFDLWDQWSALGGKYTSEMDMQIQWDSFTRRQGVGQKQVTMASVLKMVKDANNQPVTAEALKAKVAEIEQMVANLPAAVGVHTPEGYLGKFPVITAGTIARREPNDWFIKGLLPKADLVVLYGASGSGKTFVALDLAAAIARGVAWRDLRTKKARVLYIAAEGGGSVGKRFEAYARHHDINASDLDIGVITVPPNFMAKDDIGELVASITASGGVDLIIVDTYAQVTPGSNENSGEDMGLALANARSLTEAAGATVLLVHHSGKDASRGARGWSGLRAAADAQLEIVKHDSGARELRIDKMKDGDDGLNWGFKLEVIDVGVDRDGDTITSCVAIEAEAPVAQPSESKADAKKAERFGGIERHVLEIIAADYPSQASVSLNKLVDACVVSLPEPDEGKRDVRRQSVARAVQTLSKRASAPIAIKDGLVIFYVE